MTKIWKVSEAPSDAEIAEVAALLKAGGVVLLPTDTIYGLHAVATDSAAVARIVAMKGRDADKPLVVLGASADALKGIGALFTPEMEEALAELWPGPLTAIVPLEKPVAASRAAASLGVRVPAVAWLARLLAITGPLASTSANRSGEPPVSEPKELPHDLQKSLDGIVDVGRVPGKASTIVNFIGDEPRLVRSGEDFFTQKVWKTLRKRL